MKRSICTAIAFIVLLISINIMTASAAGTVNVRLSFSPSTVRSGDSVTVSVNLSGVSGAGGVASGTVVVGYDSSKLSYQSGAIGGGKPAADLDINTSGSNITLLYLDNKGGSGGFSSDGAMATLKFSVKNTEPGTAAFSLTTDGFGDKNASAISANASGASLTIAAPLSGNNNLSSLTVSNAAISPAFSAGNINYTTSVPFTTSKLDVKATTEDGGATASVSSPELKAGGTTNVTVTVTAANDSKKVYTIKVTREQDPDYDAKSNNNLSALTVSNAAISPAFDKGTVNYTASVAFEVSKLEISATAENKDAKVEINSPALTANSTTDATVTVTSVYGGKKVYTIKVTRAQDPNFVGSANNNLSSITVDGFLLSPVFAPDIDKYIIWLPYETESVTVNAKAEDEKSNVEISGGQNLAAGQDNTVVITCISESGARKEYTVIAKRAAAHDGSVDEKPDTENTPSGTQSAGTGFPLWGAFLLLFVGLAAGFGGGFFVLKKLGKQ